MRPLPLTFYLLLAIGLIVANTFIYKAVFAPPLLRVSIFEVGKGHATLLRTSRGETILIDTGSDASILRSLGTALPFWQRDIDAAILTSATANSTGGLSDIRHRYTIKNSVSFGSTPLTAGGMQTSPPYGTKFTFGPDTSILIIAPYTFNISYGATSLSISSSTPPGVYISDGISSKQE